MGCASAGVGWKDDVEAVLGKLPTRFRIEDVYRFVPFLHARHPQNFHVEEKIRQVLQSLREEGKLRFVDQSGTYERTGGADISNRFPFEPGQLTKRAAIAQVLGQAGPAPLGRGMFKPASGPFRNHMFLFHNERENPYGDVHEGSIVRYVGQGQAGNQELKGFNATLATHLENGIQVHYFVQPRDAPGKVRYVGPVVVDEFHESWRPEQNRSVWEFVLLPAQGDPDPLGTYSDMLRSMLAYEHPAGPVDRPLVERTSMVRLRARAFRELVIPAYSTQCAACREPLRKDDRVNELEAAHIQAVSAGGPDELRNGLSLCGRHHWCFDNGMFTVSDGLQIEWRAPTNDPHGEIRDGMDLFVPVDDPHKPHPAYLAWHRRYSGVALSGLI